MHHSMPPLPRVTAAIVLGLCALVVATDTLALSPKARARIEKGEIVTWARQIKGREVPQANAIGLVDTEPAVVWSVVEDCANYKDTLSRVEKSKLVRKFKRGGKDVLICEVELGLPFPLSNLTIRTEAVHTVRPGTYYAREWKLDAPKGPDDNDDVKYTDGFWKLEPYEHEGRVKTLVRYRTHSEPNNAVPTWVLKKAQSSALPDVVRNLRDQAIKRSPRHRGRK